MKWLILVTLFFLSVSCAPVQVDDMKIVHSVELQNVEAYFRAYCIAEYPSYTSAQIDACADEETGKFLQTFN